MKRSVVLLSCLLVLALVPGLVSAQNWLGLPGLPGLPSLRGGAGCGSCGDPVGGAMFGANVAYVGYPHATVVEFTPQGPGVLGLRKFRQAYPVHGIQLSADAAATPNDRVMLIARGTWLISSNGESFAQYNYAPDGRQLSTSTQWWTVEGAGAWALGGTSAVLAGLRYDSFQTNFSDPSSAAATFIGTQSDADLQVSLWIPYVGMVAHLGSAKFGVIGSPWLPGNVRYRESLELPDRVSTSGNFSHGYFIEAWGEYNVNLMGASAGVFAKYTYVHGRAVASLEDRRVVGASANDTFDLTFDRPNWILGAQAALNFNSPW